MATRGNEKAKAHRPGDNQSPGTSMYVRFGAMIPTAMVGMYWVMFVSTYEWSHVRWSESRLYMALTMGGTMGLVMLAWMLNMYRDTKANVAIVAASILLLAVSGVPRSQPDHGGGHRVHEFDDPSSFDGHHPSRARGDRGRSGV